MHGTNKRVKIIMVDDSALVLHIYRKMLASFPEIELLATFTSAKDALDSIPVLNPDVITTDYHMPGMDGLQFIEEVMEKNPKPILVISSSVQATGDEDTIFALLEAGAVDVFPKPLIQVEEEFKKTGSILVKKLHLLSGVLTLRRKRKSTWTPEPYAASYSGSITPVSGLKMVGVGASTGGPQVLTEIFQNLIPDFHLPIVCVQHISEGFITGLVEWLDKVSPLRVGFAANNLTPEKGTIYFPPENTHLKFSKDGRFVIDTSPAKNGHRPAVDETFSSLAETFGNRSLAILLTGMGGDGALGMKSVKEKGGFTVAQEEKSCIVYGMPRVAVEMGGVDVSLPPSEIISLLNNLKP